MPIPAKRLETPNPPELPDTPEVPLPPSVRSAISWISPAGSEVMLTGDISGVAAGVIVTPGIKGFDAPPYALTLDDLPALDGSAFRHVRATVRELFLPLLLWAPTRGRLVALKRDLLAQMNPKQGAGTLKVAETSDAGATDTRFIDCYYSGGLEGDDQDGAGFTYCQFGVTFQCPDPYWYGPAISPDVPIKVGSVKPVNFFTGKKRGEPDEEVPGPWYPALHLSASSYIPPGGYVIANPGDIESWPVWTIKAANATAVTLTVIYPDGSSKRLRLSYTFADYSDPVTIDTRPGRKLIYNSAGPAAGNLWSRTGPNPQLCPFMSGVNRVRAVFDAEGVGDLRAEVTYSFNPRYLGA